MADDSTSQLTTTGDYSKVPVQIAAGGTGPVVRPTKGAQLVWGGSDPSSPWGQLVALIKKGGGSVSYLQISSGEIAKSAFAPTGAPGDAPVTGADEAPKPEEEEKQDDEPKVVAPKPHPAAPGLEHVSGPEGTGALFEYGIDIGYQGEPARLWAHPRAANSGPRPLIIYLHGINAQGEPHPQLASPAKGGGYWYHMGKLAESMVKDGKVTPLAMAAPTHSSNAPWNKIGFEELVNAAETKFKESGVEIDLDQICVVGHSGAGGYPKRGLNKLADEHGMIGTHKLKLFGIADIRIYPDTATNFKTGLKDNDTTQVYALHRQTGGWSAAEYNNSGGSPAFAKALGATNANKTQVVGEEAMDSILEYWDNQDATPSRVSIKVKVPMSEFVAQWRAVGAYGKPDRGYHWNMVPRWTAWALPRFFAQTDADKKLLSAPAATPAPETVPVAPPAPPPTAAVTGGEFNIPPAAKPWVNPAGEIPARSVDDFEFSKPTGLYYPVRAEKLPAGRGVYYIGSDDTGYGPGGRGCAAAGYFLANRGAGRKHVGIDMSVNAFNSMVVACESGTIVNFYWFFQNAYCLIVQCDSGIVLNYGEIDKDSLKDYKLKVGSHVTAGQPIGNIRKMDISAMLHFENYKQGTKANCNYYPTPANDKQKDKTREAKAKLYNPTQYVLALAKNGR